ncbi:hypothetical protein M422DRAFT_270100 [Sphaerobolus stellatus SS14]|uniref:Uncharacterized protein n=1 Tax=Sphaerobolus stellatus (strain SS14) TaxID=990650 RepID=A0A0C9UI29_SPHS4|nr:hypothetical protein M422DRAFT_270100 [Sphaerobolus stellatus SS14]
MSTAERWLKKLGYKAQKHHKDIYMDGHECKDVMEYQNKFLKVMESLEHLMIQYDMEGKPIYPKLQPGEKVHHAIAHDESGFHMNDQQSISWLAEG